MTPTDPGLLASIILPTYNEAGHIVSLIQDLDRAVAGPKEIVVVDDRSPDGTADQVAAMQHSAVVLVRRAERGLVSALQAGLDRGQGQVVAWMDADYSHPPEIAGRLVAAVRSGRCDVAIAARFLPGGGETAQAGDPALRRLQIAASRWANHLLRAWLDPACADWTSGFVAARAEVIRPLRLQGYYGDYFIRLVGGLIAAGARIEEIPYHSPPRRSGVSKTATGWRRMARLLAAYLAAGMAARRAARRGHVSR